MKWCPICMSSLIAETRTISLAVDNTFANTGTGKFVCSSCDRVFEIQELSSDEDWREK